MLYQRKGSKRGSRCAHWNSSAWSAARRWCRWCSTSTNKLQTTTYTQYIRNTYNTATIVKPHIYSRLCCIIWCYVLLYYIILCYPLLYYHNTYNGCNERWCSTSRTSGWDSRTRAGARRLCPQLIFIHIHQLFRILYTLFWLDTANIYWWWCMNFCRVLCSVRRFAAFNIYRWSRPHRRTPPPPQTNWLSI